MTPTLETLFASQPDLVAQIRAQDKALARELLERFTRPLPRGEPFDWAVAELILDTPTIKGQPFNPVGRQYLRDPINDINADDCREQTCCWGTGNAKTLKNIVQATWAMEHAPFSGLFILPSKEGPGGGRQFNNGSLIPTIERTRCFAGKIPTGADRHNFSGLHLQFAGNNIDLAGANSPTQLGAKRCQFVWLDEQDKYKAKLGREEGADYLAGERTKQVPNAKIIRGSTPTKEDFGIWPHLMRSDLRRRFLPCPHCNQNLRSSAESAGKGWFVLIKDEQYSVLPTKFPDGTPIPFAQMRWDKEAKRTDGTWDIDRVIRSTRFECPHCGGHIRDHHRVWMDAHAVWRPTRLSIGHKGYHLPSFNAPHIDQETSWGHMAKKFLDKRESGEIQGYINSDLAEVHVRQEAGNAAIEITTTSHAQDDWIPLLTADFQKNWPYVWFVVRRWCAFKLLPPFGLSNGRPDFVEALEAEENAAAKAICLRLVNGVEAAWFVVAELMRFDTRTGRSPLIEYLLAQDITGAKLVHLYRAPRAEGGAESDTRHFRQLLHEAIARAAGHTGPVRPPRGGDSELLAAGHCALSGEYVWDELKDIIAQFKVGRGLAIPNHGVLIDCGYAEKFNREVLRKCYESASEYKFYDPMSKNRPAIFYRQPIHNFCLPVPRDGWLAVKGYPINQRWNHGGIRNELNLNIEDPFYGGPNAGTAMVEVLELPSGLFWLRKEDLRQKRSQQTYTISAQSEWFPKIHAADGTPTGESSFKPADYQRQINEQYYDEARGKVEPRHGRGGTQGRLHPYHLDDCETYQIAAATHHGFFDNQK